MNNGSILFNRKVLDKHLSNFSCEVIPEYEQKHREMLKWKKSVEDSDLKKTKEESVQGKFLTSVFETVLGYATFLGGGEYNQIQEFTSELDSTEADGALGFFTQSQKQVRAVIELKDANTNLDMRQSGKNNQTPVEKGFGYAHKNGSGCGWVIISNFKEIRLYKSSSSLEYEKFLVTKLDDEAEFKRFYYLLCKDNLLQKDGKSRIDRLYEENGQAQKDISDRFYNKYKSLRAELFQSLKDNNSQFDEMVLFQSAQKILDRFIFICFCESSGLLPKGTFNNAIKAGKNSYVRKPLRLWEQVCGLFDSIDQGNPPMEINGYNGGLFRHDAQLDSLVVTDKPLERFTALLEYDFGSDLNVNILGHIFEHSISDLEQIKAEIAGKNTDNFRGKKKDDGIYYTPNYVTQYIVKQTIGGYLSDKREEIGFDALPCLEESDYRSIKLKGNNISYNENIAAHVRALEAYRNMLSNLKVLDPACGSGAFLNEAFDFLKHEFHTVHNELGRITKGNIALVSHWENHILANNIYGVDLNPESIEITKLSLWLKTASKDEKLMNLDDNIKVGNSLVRDTTVAGDQAFDWRVEFAEIIDSGGFDVVIGNPPYGASLSKAEKDYIAANYETTEYNFDTYKTFMELGLKLIKPNGYMGYITPNTYFVLEKGATKLRKFLFEKHTLISIAELFNVFPDAVVDPIISIYKNGPAADDTSFFVISVPRKTELSSNFVADGVRTTFTQSDLKENVGYRFIYRATEAEKRIIRKINDVAKPLLYFFTVTTGMKPYQKGKGFPPQTQDIVDTKPFQGYEKIDENWLPYVRGKTFERYTDTWCGEYIKYGEWLAEPRKAEMFLQEKIFIRRTDDYPIATYDNSGKIGNNSIHCIYSKNADSPSLKYLLGVINSKFMRWFFQFDNFHMVGKTFAEIKVVFVERFPIVVAQDQSTIICLVDQLLEKSQSRFDKAKEFIDYITRLCTPKSISERLWAFYKLEFKDFIDELKKQKACFDTKPEIELVKDFDKYKTEINDLTKTINKLDAEVDRLVYALYCLTDEEIAIVENT